jgi:hypothetical protein
MVGGRQALTCFLVAATFLTLTIGDMPRTHKVRGHEDVDQNARSVASGMRRAVKSNPMEFSTHAPTPLSKLAADALDKPTCVQRVHRSIPSVVHQIWLGGIKLMYAKLLSVMSVHYVLQPRRQFLWYDVLPRNSKGELEPEWRCACLLATCRQISVQASISHTPFDGNEYINRTYEQDRYASDTLRRCANSQLDLLRLELLQNYGGFVLDLDVFVLRSLDAWRRCTRDAVVGWGGQLHAGGGQVSSGVMLGTRDAPFYRQWRRRLIRDYEPSSTDFGGKCNASTYLALRSPHLVHVAPELGPLPRYAERRLYEQHLEHAPITHLSAFRHTWRLHDVMVHRLLEKVANVVLAAANRSRAGDGKSPSAKGLRKGELIAQCFRTIRHACWAKPGGKCGIYGA